MAFAMSLTNYMISQQIPDRAYDWLSAMGVNQRWEFLLALNAFLYLMVMDGISMIIVSVPLVTPFAARFGIQPFHMCIMFLLNLEVCNLTPPFGQNVFVASYRFNRPTMDLYRYTFPFLAIMALGLILVDAVPRISTVAVERDIADAKTRAAKTGEPPTDAWLMECVQEDRNNPLPCTPEDKKKWAAVAGVNAESVEKQDEEVENLIQGSTD
jgi:Mg2+/citrate symporter